MIGQTSPKPRDPDIPGDMAGQVLALEPKVTQARWNAAASMIAQQQKG